MPEDRALRLFLEVEQIERLTNFSVIALFSFFQAHQMVGQLLIIGPSSAINTLQLRVLGVATPISASQLHQLEGFAQPTGRRQMRPTTQILPAIALAIDSDDFTRRDDVIDDIGLKRLPNRIEMRDSVIAVHLLANDGKIGIDNLAHALFDGFEVIG